MGKITEEQKKEIKEKYLEILNVTIVAETLGYSKSTVCQVIKELRVDLIAACPVCNKNFTYRYGKVYCSNACWMKAYRGKKAKNEAKYQKEHSTVILREKKEAEHKKKVQTLAELVNEAREHHMTYGKYIMMLEQKKNEKG